MLFTLPPPLHALVDLTHPAGVRSLTSLPPGVTVQDVVDAARHHGMVLTLSAALRGDMGPLADALRSALTDQQRRWTLAGMRLTFDLCRLAKAFAQAQLPWLALKGPALSFHLQGDPLRRDCLDLDILVREQDLLAVHEVLTGLGYSHADAWGAAFIRQMSLYQRRREYNLSYRNQQTGTFLEVHWRWARVDALAPLDPDLVWPQRQTRLLMDTEIPVLHPVVELVYLATHAARHGCCKLKWLQDFRLILARPEAETLVAAALDQARRQDVLAAVAASLTLAAELDGRDVPALAAAARETRWTGRLLACFRREFTRAPERRRRATLAQELRVWQLQHLLLAAKQHPRRRDSLARLLTASPAERAVLPLPPALEPLYLLLRPVLWMVARLRS